MNRQPNDTNDKPHLRSSSIERPAINYNETKSRKEPTNTKKRKANDSSPSKLTPEPKKGTASKMALTLDDLKELFDKQTDKIQSHVQLTIKNEMKILSEELKANLDSQIDKINQRIESIQESVNVQFNEVRAEIYDCSEKLKLTEEDSKRISVLNELRLKGIAHSRDENLNEIFLSIANLIGFDTTNPLHVPSISRSFVRDARTNEIAHLPHILIKFVAKHIRNQFYGLYLSKASKQPILLEHINLSQGGRILIMENLTHHNNTIFIEAMKAKKEKKLTNVKTIEGQVYVRTNLADKYSCMRSIRELEVLIAKSSSQFNSQPSPYPAPNIVSIQQQHLHQAQFSMAHSQTHEHQTQVPNTLPINSNQTDQSMES